MDDSRPPGVRDPLDAAVRSLALPDAARLAVADITPPPVLAVLATHRDLAVRAGVAGRPRLASSVQDRIVACGSDADVVRLAQHQPAAARAMVAGRLPVSLPADRHAAQLVRLLARAANPRWPVRMVVWQAARRALWTTLPNVESITDALLDRCDRRRLRRLARRHTVTWFGYRLVQRIDRDDRRPPSRRTSLWVAALTVPPAVVPTAAALVDGWTAGPGELAATAVRLAGGHSP